MPTLKAPCEPQRTRSGTEQRPDDNTLVDMFLECSSLPAYGPHPRSPTAEGADIAAVGCRGGEWRALPSRATRRASGTRSSPVRSSARRRAWPTANTPRRPASSTTRRVICGRFSWTSSHARAICPAPTRSASSRSWATGCGWRNRSRFCSSASNTASSIRSTLRPGRSVGYWTTPPRTTSPPPPVPGSSSRWSVDRHTLVRYSNVLDTGQPVPGAIERVLLKRALPEMISGLRAEATRRLG